MIRALHKKSAMARNHPLPLGEGSVRVSIFAQLRPSPDALRASASPCGRGFWLPESTFCAKPMTGEIHDLMAEVRRLLESAEFDSALRLSERCISLAERVSDPILKAQAMVTRGIALARVDEHAKAVPYYDEA